jgi:hypothetical protein
MNTDEMWEGNMRASRTSTRYQVGHAKWGLLETFSRKLDACEYDLKRSSNEKVEITVFDALARRGAVELWTCTPLEYVPVPTRWKP